MKDRFHRHLRKASKRRIKFVTKILWKHQNTNRSYLQLTDEKYWWNEWLASPKLLPPAVIDHINKAIYEVVSSYKV